MIKGFFFASIWVNGNTTLSEKFFYSGWLSVVMWLVCVMSVSMLDMINEIDKEK